MTAWFGIAFEASLHVRVAIRWNNYATFDAKVVHCLAARSAALVSAAKAGSLFMPGFVAPIMNTNAILDIHGNFPFICALYRFSVYV